MNEIPYKSLEPFNKVTLLNTALDLLAYKPSLIGDVKTDAEFLDRIEAFAKLIHERFPGLKRTGSVIVNTR
jgi:hypothetical protein